MVSGVGVFFLINFRALYIKFFFAANLRANTSLDEGFYSVCSCVYMHAQEQ